MRLVTLGVGAQASPVYAPAGLLIAHRGRRVMLDGGPGAEPDGKVDAWLVTDASAELRAELRRLGRKHALVPHVGTFADAGLVVRCKPVVHTNHPTYGYLIEASRMKIVWAPEFFRFPRWARDAHLMFAEAAGWNRPIRFVGGVGGHMAALDVAAWAERARVKRLVFAHIGRPTLRAMGAGLAPPFGEFAHDEQVFYVRKRSR